MNVFAKFDEIPSMFLQEIKHYKHTFICLDLKTESVGYKNDAFKSHIVLIIQQSFIISIRGLMAMYYRNTQLISRSSIGTKPGSDDKVILVHVYFNN